MSTTNELFVLPFDESLGSLTMVERYWRLQDKHPVARVMTSTGDEAWLVSRFEDVKFLLADRRLGRSHPDPGKAPRLYASLGGGPSMKFETEIAEHDVIRKVITAPFSPGHAAAVRPFAEATANELLDAIMVGPIPVDCYSTYAVPLLERVTARHLGLPPGFTIPNDEILRFLESTEVLTCANVSSFARQANGDVNGLTKFAVELLAAKRADPGDDVLSELVRAQDGPGLLDEGQVLYTTLVLLMSANGSTIVRIGTGVGLLQAYPEQYAMLVRDPSLVSSAVDEIMRFSNGIYDPSIRYARTDLELHDVLISAGDLVLLDITSAHCDPRVFPDPLVFDITRRPNRNIGFGHGSSRCAGVTLARLNLETAFGTLARRCVSLPFIQPSPPRDRPLAIW
ncbi:cytochrome P450 [Lentzea sp. NPDC006480]|uniref:cytochrome P450 n=1 Tax=Lentzea sp. NPDC006480 TaxID=3157176 RepID=UPI0033AC40BF